MNNPRQKYADELFGHFPKKLLDRFKKYHAANPHVYDAFVEFARQMKSAGHNKYSASAIIQRIRWEMDIKTTGKPFKIDDSFTPIYGRLADYQHPDLRKFFGFRK
jgi:alpha-acetolactate decarboxylase